MGTHGGHRSAPATATLDGEARQAETVGARILTWMKQRYCSLRGHDNLMHFEKHRVYLQCVSCGRQTPGWTISETAPRVLFRGDARRHALVRPHLVSARRIA